MEIIKAILACFCVVIIIIPIQIFILCIFFKYVLSYKKCGNCLYYKSPDVCWICSDKNLLPLQVNECTKACKYFKQG